MENSTNTPNTPGQPLSAGPTPPINPNPAPQPFVAPNTAPDAAPATQKPKTGLIVGLIIGAVALIIGIIGVIFLAGRLTALTAEDYHEVYELISDYDKDSSELSYRILAYDSDSASDSEKAASDIQELKDITNTFFDEISAAKAVKRDQELGEAVKKITDQRDAIDQALDNASEIYQYIIPAFSSIYELDTDMNESDIDDIIKNFENISGKLKVEANKKFINAEISALKEFRNAFSRYKKATHYSTELYREYRDAVEKLTSTTEDWQTDFQDNFEKIKINEQLQDASDIAFDKELELEFKN